MCTGDRAGRKNNASVSVRVFHSVMINAIHERTIKTRTTVKATSASSPITTIMPTIMAISTTNEPP